MLFLLDILDAHGVVALGLFFGINPEKIAEMKSLGYDGSKSDNNYISEKQFNRMNSTDKTKSFLLRTPSTRMHHDNNSITIDHTIFPSHKSSSHNKNTSSSLKTDDCNGNAFLDWKFVQSDVNTSIIKLLSNYLINRMREMSFTSLTIKYNDDQRIELEKYLLIKIAYLFNGITGNHILIL